MRYIDQFGHRTIWFAPFSSLQYGPPTDGCPAEHQSEWDQFPHLPKQRIKCTSAKIYQTGEHLTSAEMIHRSERILGPECTDATDYSSQCVLRIRTFADVKLNEARD